MTQLLTAEPPLAAPNVTPSSPEWRLELQLLHRSTAHSTANRAAARAAPLNWLTSSSALRPLLLRHSLPEDAYNGVPFELIGEGVCVRARRHPSGKLWTFAAEHPDRIARKGRDGTKRWRLETVVADNGDHDLLGTRLYCYTDGTYSSANTPRVHKEFIAAHALIDGTTPISNAPLMVTGHQSYEELVDRLLSPDRRLPLVVVSGTGDDRPGRNFIVDPDSLAASLQGLAHVATLTSDHWNSLRRDMGAKLGVSHGSVRVFQPGVTAGDESHSRWVYGRNGMPKPFSQTRFESSLYHRLRHIALRSPDLISQWPDVEHFDRADKPGRGVLLKLKRLFTFNQDA